MDELALVSPDGYVVVVTTRIEEYALRAQGYRDVVPEPVPEPIPVHPALAVLKAAAEGAKQENADLQDAVKPVKPVTKRSTD